MKITGYPRSKKEIKDVSIDLLPRFFYLGSVFPRTSFAKILAILIMISTKKPLRIILDDEDDRMLFKEVINDLKENIEVVMFENGDDLMSALKHPGASLPDFIFLDLNMPLKNGHECLRELRSLDSLSSVPVVIYSTTSNKEQIDKTYTEGANLYIRKPTSFKALKEMAENVFTINWNKYLPRPKKENFIWSQGRIMPLTPKTPKD